MNLCVEKRGENITYNYPTPGRIELHCELQLAEVDFYDKLKSLTQDCCGSFDYQVSDMANNTKKYAAQSKKFLLSQNALESFRQKNRPSR
ncbi:hypothetical protein [Candidatus Electronema sp. JM]|uniref:hypothetical protein n=1 Tax=Candidatus Electronema sp. JM TaxID=3401571 RepID=UPI003AA89CDA